MKSTLSPTFNLAFQHREAQSSTSPESNAGLAWAEIGLLLACVAALALGAWGPFIAQPASYHVFADHRSLWGVPQAMDVLSNLPFAIAGIWGLVILYDKGKAVLGAEGPLAYLFFAGLIVTSLCSGIYHLHPANTTLALDRLGMVSAFAGLLGLAVADRISIRAGRRLTLGILTAGPLAVITWTYTGNLLPWVVLQGGGMVLLATLAVSKPLTGSWLLPMGSMIGFYLLAKFLEIVDCHVFQWSGGYISGHTLKHLAAAMVAWPVIVAANKTGHIHVGV